MRLKKEPESNNCRTPAGHPGPFAPPSSEKSRSEACRTRAWSITGLCLCACLSLSTLGCSSNEAISADVADPVGSKAAARLQQLMQRYAKASRYSDRARVHLEYGEAGQRTSEISEIQTDYERPNRLSLQIQRGINRLQLVSNGKTLWVAIEDPLTNNLQGQVVHRPAPSQLSVDEVYAATELVDPMRPQEMLSVLLGLPLDLQRSPLGLLMGSGAWRSLLGSPRNAEALPDQAWRDRQCHRVRLPSPAKDGDYVFWIDAEIGALRRLDFPTGQLFSQLPAEQRPRNVNLWMEMDPVLLDGSERTDRFTAQPPADTTSVQHFVLPPMALPTQRFGQAIGNLEFEALDGSVQTARDWGNRIAVLVWFQNHATSRAVVPRLDQVAAQFQQRKDRLVWRAVHADAEDRQSAEQLRQLVATWGSQLPIVRDTKAVGRDQLDITQAPTVVVLDAKRRLHMFEVGANPNLSQTLALVLQRLLAGEDVALDVQRNYEAEMAAYQRHLDVARLPAGEPSTIAKQQFPPASEPAKLQRAVRWESRALTSPGNLVIVDDPSTSSRLIVVEQMQEAVELDRDGEIVRRFPLQIDDTSPMAQLAWCRSTEGTGNFVAFTPLGQRLGVYDRDFRLLLRYPSDNQRHPGIMTATLADLDGDQQQELYVGFADPVGLQRIELDGSRRWTNRAIPGVVSIAPRWLAKPPYLLVTGERGLIVPISRSGVEGSPIALGQRTIHQLVGHPDREPHTIQFLGMSYTLDGRLIAVGLTPDLQEAWSYGLPGGVYNSPVRTPVWARMLAGSRGQWLLAGPDGSVHLIDDSGDFYDMFHVGAPIDGLGGFQADGQGVLVVVSRGTVTAYNVNRPKQ